MLAPSLVAFLVLGTAGESRGTIVTLATASGSGTNNDPGSSGHTTVSASVTFAYDTASPNQLIIDLSNTTPGGTPTPADVLIGLTYSVGGVGGVNFGSAMPLSPTLPGGSTELGGTTSFANTWNDAYNKGGNTKVTGDFGIATNGFNGAFTADLKVGSTHYKLNNANFGIVATGTSLTGGLSAQEPFSGNTLEFVLKDTSAGFSFAGATFSNVNFLFGTSGDGVIRGTVVPPKQPPSATPEPGTLALASIGLASIGWAKARRRRPAIA
ncbi:MAG TPA: XDD4 family exosortase-dependent surface protein [Isosphaeraceae bacterium]|jgi:hypothetical protein|nr:XDD4 family exosortase-dependent surface protein [Isosphaeraceae bacterium]